MPTRLGARAIAILVAVAAIVLFLLWAPASCRSAKGLKKQAEVSAEQGNASIHAGSEALNTVGNVMANDSATDARVIAGQDAISKAPKGQKGKTARKVACGFKSTAKRPECKEPVK